MNVEQGWNSSDFSVKVHWSCPIFIQFQSVSNRNRWIWGRLEPCFIFRMQSRLMFPYNVKPFAVYLLYDFLYINPWMEITTSRRFIMNFNQLFYKLWPVLPILLSIFTSRVFIVYILVFPQRYEGAKQTLSRRFYVRYSTAVLHAFATAYTTCCEESTSEFLCPRWRTLGVFFSESYPFLSFSPCGI